MSNDTDFLARWSRRKRHAGMARAALRRAWPLDPAIRDFVGLSENSWDLNAPGAMAGFGPIDEKEVERLLTRLLGEPDTMASTVHPPVQSHCSGNLNSRCQNVFRHFAPRSWRRTSPSAHIGVGAKRLSGKKRAEIADRRGKPGI
jgi:hypothetical protein